MSDWLPEWAWITLGVVAGVYLLWKLFRPRYNFRDKTVIITGGSRGLGLCMAREFQRRGARLGICSRDGGQLAKALAELSAKGQVYGRTCDVANADDLRAWIDECRRELGPIDVFVHNAAVIYIGPYENMEVADFEAAMDISFWGLLHGINAVVPEMKARGGGRILSISSLGGLVPLPHLLPYCAAKFANTGLCVTLRPELRRHKIQITTVCPGALRTGSHLQCLYKGQHAKEYRWFATANGLPGFGMNADRAARQAVQACAEGRAMRVLSMPARMGALLYDLAPGFTTALAGWVTRRILPEPAPPDPGNETRKGFEVRGKTAKLATTLSDRAAADNNEWPAESPATGETPDHGTRDAIDSVEAASRS